MLAPAKGEVSSSRRMRPGEVADHVGAGQAGLAHGLAAGDSDRVELQVQLGGEQLAARDTLKSPSPGPGQTPS
jgi:hypothetical protein